MCGRAGDDDSAGELCSVESWTRSCAAIRLGPLRLGVVDVSHLAQLAVALPIALLLIRRSGAVRWARLLPNARARAVAVGPRGDVAIAGEFSNTLVLDGESVVAIDGEDLFLLGLDAGGAVRWLRGFVSGGDAEVHDLAVDAWGRVTLVASSPLNGGVDFGGPPAPPDLHGFVATFSNDGNHLESLAFGLDPATAPRAVVATSNGDTVMAGVFGGSVAFAGPSGGLALTAAGPRDIFLVRRDASGAASWARRFGGAQDQSATRLLLATDETLWLGGTSTTSTSTTTGDGGGAACIPMACDSTWVTVYVGQSVSSCALIVLLVSAGRDARYQGRLLVDAGGMSAGLLLWVPLWWALPEVRTVSLIGGTRARFGA